MPDGSTLLELRRIADLPQSAIAEQMNISESAVSQIERRDYVRSDTAMRYQKAVVNRIREQAISTMLADYVKATVTQASEHGGWFVTETA